MSNGNPQPTVNVGGFISTIIWGVAAGMGLKLGFGIVELVFNLLARAASGGGPTLH